MARLRHQYASLRTQSLLPLKFLNFLIYGAMVIFAAFFQLYLQEAGMNKLEIGLLLSMGPIVSLAANPFWKYCNDRQQNTKYVLLLMMSGLLLVGYLIFLVDTYRMLYWTMILFYFLQTPLLAQSNTMTLCYAENSGRRFESFRMWGSLGWACVAVAAGAAMDASGAYGMYLLFMLVLFLAISSALVLRPLRRAPDTPWLNLWEFTRSLRNRYFVSFIILGMLVAVPSSMNAMFMPFFITDLGGSRLYVGLAVFVSTILEAGVFMLLRRYMTRKITHLMVCMFLVSLLLALRWMMMAEVTSSLQIVFIQVLHAVTFGGFFYVGTQLTTLFLPRPYRSSGQAVYTLVLGGISGMIAGAFGGWLYHYFGAVTMYKISLMLTLCGTLGFAVMGYRLYRHGYTPVIHHKE
ncbi:MFS transporter [Paenibacillus sp. YPG26]|uniref:MFS transporter n=1 Tax=Paenibacillus sp. YPG26 TaxID=2878915 RepID=UPI00203D6FD2|nr:MFS transporter [Paenibacillus sp. YPG26]USB32920.1 MFS transporter [Paenibacillus sp. YPG26]